MEEERFPDLEEAITVIKVATGNLMHRACFLDNGDATKAFLSEEIICLLGFLFANDV